MQIEDCPKDTFILGSTRDEGILARYLHEVLDGEPYAFPDVEPIRGADHSIRILYQEPRDGIAPLPRPLTPEEAACEFTRFGRDEARYPEQHRPHQHKGWEVQWATINGRRVAIIHAAWVEH